MKKNINRKDSFYIFEFVFHFLLYFGVGFFILSMTQNKILTFYLSLLLFGVIYSSVSTEIMVRYHLGYFLTQIVLIPYLILVLVLNFNVLSSF